MDRLDLRKALPAFLIILVLIIGIFATVRNGDDGPNYSEISIESILHLTSERKRTMDWVLISDEEPIHGLMATPAACWYDIGGENDESKYGLVPLIVCMDGGLSIPQQRFRENLRLGAPLSLGNVPEGGGADPGPLSDRSIDFASELFTSSAGALIVEESKEGYAVALGAAPIASYLNIPVLSVGPNESVSRVGSFLKSIDVRYVIVAGPEAASIAGKLGYNSIIMNNSRIAEENALKVVKDRFERLDYITMTNPADTYPLIETETTGELFKESVNNLYIKTNTVEGDIIGESVHTFNLEVPDGTNRVRIYVNFTRVDNTPLDPLKQILEVEPVIFATLRDPRGEVAAYAPSFSYEVGKCYMETQTFDAPGSYELTVEVHYGVDGFNTYAGTGLSMSRIDAEFQVDYKCTGMDDPHLPAYEDLSIISSYLTASHGGVLISDPSFELTTFEFSEGASGSSTGACYQKDLHPLVNERVEKVVSRLDAFVDGLAKHGLYDDYVNGPAWLSIVGGPNMIPQYYEPKDESWVEDPIYGTGWPTDVPYSLDLTLSIARTIGRDVADTSTLIGRSLFYEEYTESHKQMIRDQYGSSEDWGRNFHFLAGEMGGRTGWFFWQNGFASEIQGHGFETEEYLQNYENDRQTMELRGAYERANFMDIMVHGNWYWYVPELNGIDSYSTSVKNSDLIKSPNEWELGPSVYVTGSCILGRIDNINPYQSLTMTFIHSGANTFFGASRSTGSEAKAGTIETSLLYDDVSIGEAMRQDKLVNREPAAYWVRGVFGDPAFNPYEPENGYSDQGRPILVGNDVDEE